VKALVLVRSELALSQERDSARETAMCVKYSEREFGRRTRPLLSEDEIVWLDSLEIDSDSETAAPIIVPALPSLEGKRRGARALIR